MRKVIIINEAEEFGERKPITFTKHLDTMYGWSNETTPPQTFEKIVYLGHCCEDGDMFAAYDSNGTISIYKGHLNDGVY